MDKIRWTRLCTTVVATALLIADVAAFQVLPKISDVDRKLANLGSNGFIDRMGQWFVTNAIPLLKSPVHEAMTLSALDCDAGIGEEPTCVTLPFVLKHQSLLYGVRWPDDPPFPLNRASPPRIKDCDPKVTLRSTAQPLCWKGLFSDAGRTAKQRMRDAPDRTAFGPGDYLLY